jgi:transposase-like protein
MSAITGTFITFWIDFFQPRQIIEWFQRKIEPSESYTETINHAAEIINHTAGKISDEMVIFSNSISDINKTK